MILLGAALLPARFLVDRDVCYIEPCFVARTLNSCAIDRHDL